MGNRRVLGADPDGGIDPRSFRPDLITGPDGKSG
jgi:hypothetical protein